MDLSKLDQNLGDRVLDSTLGLFALEGALAKTGGAHHRGSRPDNAEMNRASYDEQRQRELI